MLRGAAAEVEVLQLHRAGAAQRDFDAAAAVAIPPVVFGGNDAMERHLDAAGVADFVAHGADDFGEAFRRRRGVERHGAAPIFGMLPDELALLPAEQHRAGVEVGDPHVCGAAAWNRRPCSTNTPQRAPLATMLFSRCTAVSVKLAGKLAITSTRIGLGHLAREGVVFQDRLELVAEIDLNDVFHVLRQVGQPLLDMVRVGPDAAGDELLVEVGQVHEGGEVLAQADGIENREADFAGRHGSEQSQHRGLQRLDRLGPARFARLEQQQRMIGQRQEQRQRELRGRRLQPRIVRECRRGSCSTAR